MSWGKQSWEDPGKDILDKGNIWDKGTKTGMSSVCL